ncbi:MAG: hydroxysqualene dehydroxylase HpnE [Pseudomonadota bacterium]
MPRRLRVAVVGAGWAGLACAIAATGAGFAVAVFEAARMPGGRARSVEGPQGGAPLDNGQHILIGAYTETLRLMALVGADPGEGLLRQPLDLRFADGGGLALPRWPAPLDLLAGVAAARGWSWADRGSLLRASFGWQRAGFRCDPAASVAELCTGMTARVREELVDPLCVSALNTPAAEASGTVFLRVLKDALFGVPRGGDLLLPRADLGALFPLPAVQWLTARGADVRLGTRVQAIAPLATPGAQPAGWAVDGEPFDRVVLACPPGEAARLAGCAAGAEAAPWCAAARALHFEAIATIYAQAPRGLDRAMVALRCTPALPAQFVFDRGRLGGPAGLLAFVVSASREEREVLEAAVVRQARVQLGLAVEPVTTIVEKRATFACTPGLVRPGMPIAPGLLACGDYVEGPYPATLEGAVRSGLATAKALQGSIPP